MTSACDELMDGLDVKLASSDSNEKYYHPNGQEHGAVV